MDGETLRTRCPGIGIQTDSVSIQRDALLLVDGIDEVSDGFTGFNRSEFAGGSVVICSANEKDIVFADQHPHPAGVDVCRNVCACQVPYM
jgi:hypothetical protein